MNIIVERLLERIMKYSSKFMDNLSSLEKSIIDLIGLIIERFPSFETLAFQAIEIAFGPRQIMYYFILVGGLQSVVMLIECLRMGSSYFLLRLTPNGRKLLELTSNLSKSSSYEEWKKIATELDHLRGFDKWQIEDTSSFYDYRVLKKRIVDTYQMIQNGDVFNLIFRLRGGLARDQFGVMHEALFSKAMAGTKNIVERYHESVSTALNFISDSPIFEDEV
jgi:hypothetical protein